MIKAKIRVFVNSKWFEKTIELPCLTPRLFLGVGSYWVDFSVNQSSIIFDEKTRYVFLEADGAFYTPRDTFGSVDKALRVFARDANWTLPSSGMPARGYVG